MAEEAIVLPKSGLVIPRHPAQPPRWELRAGDLEFVVERTFVDGSRWYAGSGLITGDRTRYCVGHRGTREECIAWLDDRIMKLRAALLPPDAFVVECSPKAVEVAAQALMTHDAYNPKTLVELDASTNRHLRAAAAIYRDRASVVIEALREVKRG